MASIDLIDLDNVELVEAVEKAFEITISDTEALHCCTVGDLYLIVASKISHADRGQFPCLTATAFRRLRVALRPNSPVSRIRPSTALSELMPRRNQRRWRHELSQATGMVMPGVDFGEPGSWVRPEHIGLLAGAVSWLGGAGYWSGVLGIAGMLIALQCKQASVATDITLGFGFGATVGDLAKATAALNAGLLARPYGQMRRGDIWISLEGVIRCHTGFSGPIEKRTAFRVL